jgi:putative alpha-1,2-mannosidase
MIYIPKLDLGLLIMPVSQLTYFVQSGQDRSAIAIAMATRDRAAEHADDDWAASIVARHAGAHQDASTLLERSKNYRNLWNANTGFMEARNSDGSWAGDRAGWTEGDHWAYSLNVMVS